MIITERDYPVLLKLKTKTLGKVDLYSVDAEAKGQVDGFGKLWAGVSIGINNQIYYLGSEFAKAYDQARNEIFNSFPYHLIEDDNVCLLHENQMAICVNIRHNQMNKIIACTVFCFTGQIITAVGKYEIGYANEHNLVRMFNGWKSFKLLNLESNLLNCILMTLFIKTPEVLKVKVQSGSFINPFKNTSFMPVVVLAIAVGKYN